MDRDANLEAVRENVEMDAASMDSDDSESDEKGDGGIRRGDPNKFDSLCDGVLGTMALVHANMQQMLELKDELMKHNLPANVLTRVNLGTSKMFRSIGDMHMPINELIRMVRIYSTPWEEKSAALKKLHDDYDAKKSQLNIAIKRLQMVDAQSRRMNKEKRLMNWEKLFCRVTTARGHGRRWKFLIDSFKKKAQEGIPALQQYLDRMEEASESEGEDEPEPVFPDTQIQQIAPSDDDITESEEAGQAKAESKTDRPKESDSEAESSGADASSLVKLPEPPVQEVVTMIRPPMKDTETNTGEPAYDRYLYVRVYTPQGLDYRELKCTFICGKQSYKTGILDPLPEDDSTEAKQETPKEEKISEPSVAKRPGRGPGLMGTRGGTVKLGDSPLGTTSKDESSTDNSKPQDKARFEECMFSMPEQHKQGTLQLHTPAIPPPQHVRVSVHHSQKEEMVAMATIDMDDLISLELPTVVLPLPEDAADRIHPAHLLTLESDGEDDSSSQAMSRSEPSKSVPESKYNLPGQYWGVDPVKFPLYSVETGPGPDVHLPCGQLPIVFFWAKKIKPEKYHKTTEADSLRDIVLDMTGIDLHLVTKEEINPEMVERAISVMSIKEEEKPETVLRSDYNRLMKNHSNEMHILQVEYEQRLQDLADSLQQMQAEAERQQQSAPPRATSRSYSRSTSPHHSDPRTPHPPPPQPPKPEPPKTRKRVAKSTPHFGKHLPEDFFERLQWFEEASQKHKQEVADRTNKVTSENYEKKLAGEFKLGGPTDEDATYSALQDVCLPAVFMPSKGRDLTIYNPRASKYFHATGSAGLRLTQPPSMVQLPPLPKNKVNVVNLFDVSNNFRPGGNEWLIERYMIQQELQERTRLEREAAAQQPEQEGPEMYQSEPTYTQQTPYTPTAQQDILNNYQEAMME